MTGAVGRDLTGVGGALMRLPLQLADTANIVLTVDRATIGATARDVVWTHRKTTLYRYRSEVRRHEVPVLLVFALINRPDIFDLRPGYSFVEFLLAEGFDVLLLDWGVPGPEDADLGVAEYVEDELHWAVRESLRATGSDSLTLLGWCIGAALAAIYTALHPDGAVRNLVVLTMPLDTRDSLYSSWVSRPSFDVSKVTGGYQGVPGSLINRANKLMKPVANYVTTRRRLVESVRDGSVNRTAFQAMAKWVGDNPPFPAAAFRDWITLVYKENRLAEGTLRLRGRLVDYAQISRQGVLVVTAASDHIAPRDGTLPFLTMVTTPDVTHLDRPGGHIGLMAGSRARAQIWPDIAGWLADRSGPRPAPHAPSERGEPHQSPANGAQR